MVEQFVIGLVIRSSTSFEHWQEFRGRRMNALGLALLEKGIQDTLDTGADFTDYAPRLWPIPIPNSIK